MSAEYFKAVLQKPIRQGGWTYINIPFDVEKSYGIKGKAPVRGYIDGIAFRSSLMPYGNGKHYLVVNLTIRNATGKQTGDAVDVEIQHDKGVCTVELPKPFVEALEHNPDAKTVFEKYLYSHKKEIVDWIMDTKKEEPRLKRIEKTILALLTPKKT
jgi:hypothetical protein